MIEETNEEEAKLLAHLDELEKAKQEEKKESPTEALFGVGLFQDDSRYKQRRKQVRRTILLHAIYVSDNARGQIADPHSRLEFLEACLGIDEMDDSQQSSVYEEMTLNLRHIK